MPRESEPESKPRYMTQAEVARELGCSIATVRNLIYERLIEGCQLNHRKGAALRVKRSSFESYCDRIEAEFAERLGGVA